MESVVEALAVEAGVAVVMVVAEAAAVEVVEEEAAAAATSLTSYSGNPALSHRAEHRTNAFATVPADNDTRPCCWILSSGFFRGGIQCSVVLVINGRSNR